MNMYNILLIIILAFIFATSYFFIKICWPKILFKKNERKKKETIKASMNYAVNDYIRKKAKCDVLLARKKFFCNRLVEEEKQLEEIIKIIHSYEDSTIRNLYILENIKKKEHDLVMSIENIRKRILEIMKEVSETKNILEKTREIAEIKAEKYYEETGERNIDFWWNSRVYESEYLNILCEDLLNRKKVKEN